MSKEFFSELARVLQRDNITLGAETKGGVPILVGEQSIGAVFSDGFMYRCATDLQGNGLADPYLLVSETAGLVHEYVSAVAKSPILIAETLNTEYRLLCEYNGTVLAGKKMGSSYGYQFATWDRSPDSTALNHGHYYKDGYENAKKDFAVRSGLVQGERQFTDEQLVAIHRCVQSTLDDYPLTQSLSDYLKEVRSQIDSAIPDRLGEQEQDQTSDMQQSFT